jgi:hypothetical protein
VKNYFFSKSNFTQNLSKVKECKKYRKKNFYPTLSNQKQVTKNLESKFSFKTQKNFFAIFWL